MAYAAMKPTKAGLEEPLEQIHKIRITLSSKNVKNLEKGVYIFSFWLPNGLILPITFFDNGFDFDQLPSKSVENF